MLLTLHRRYTAAAIISRAAMYRRRYTYLFTVACHITYRTSSTCAHDTGHPDTRTQVNTLPVSSPGVSLLPAGTGRHAQVPGAGGAAASAASSAPVLRPTSGAAPLRAGTRPHYPAQSTRSPRASCPALHVPDRAPPFADPTAVCLQGNCAAPTC